MKSKSNQNKFMKIIKMPIRALAKAREYYVRKMNHYADLGTCDGLGWGGPVYVEPMPRSLSTTALRTTEICRDLKELVRATSTGSLGNRILMTSHLNNASTTNKGSASPPEKKAGLGLGSGLSNCSKGVPRCGSVVMAKIEEDEPGNEEVEVDDKKTSKIRLFPTSRSKAIGETREY